MLYSNFLLLETSQPGEKLLTFQQINKTQNWQLIKLRKHLKQTRVTILSLPRITYAVMATAKRSFHCPADCKGLQLCWAGTLPWCRCLLGVIWDPVSQTVGWDCQFSCLPPFSREECPNQDKFINSRLTTLKSRSHDRGGIAWMNRDFWTLGARC